MGLLKNHIPKKIITTLPPLEEERGNRAHKNISE
jgi:hypothetical protein